MSAIKVRINGEWVNARNYQAEGFIDFTTGSYTPQDPYIIELQSRPEITQHVIQSLQEERPYQYNKNGYVYSIKRHGRDYGGIYLTREDQSLLPICDWSNVEMFTRNPLMNNDMNWYPTELYQKWTYFDILYSNSRERYYKTASTIITEENNIFDIPAEEYITIPEYICNEAGLLFKMGKEMIGQSSGPVYFDRENDPVKRIRMSDNNKTRAAYRGFYNRMTSDIAFVISSPTPAVQNQYLELPENIVIEKTTDEIMCCAVCFENKQNITFHPCNHTEICSECYVKLAKPRECPYCRGVISKIL